MVGSIRRMGWEPRSTDGFSPVFFGRISALVIFMAGSTRDGQFLYAGRFGRNYGCNDRIKVSSTTLDSYGSLLSNEPSLAINEPIQLVQLTTWRTSLLSEVHFRGVTENATMSPTAGDPRDFCVPDF